MLGDSPLSVGFTALGDHARVFDVRAYYFILRCYWPLFHLTSLGKYVIPERLRD